MGWTGKMRSRRGDGAAVAPAGADATLSAMMPVPTAAVGRWAG
jgi:hypothetical protein